MEQVGFDRALVALEQGNRVARLGWNGKGQWIYRVPGESFPARTEAARRHIGAMVPYVSYLAIKTTSGGVAPWLPSQGDLNSKDWVIFGSNEQPET